MEKCNTTIKELLECLINNDTPWMNKSVNPWLVNNLVPFVLVESVKHNDLKMLEFLLPFANESNINRSLWAAVEYRNSYIHQYLIDYLLDHELKVNWCIFDAYTDVSWTQQTESDMNCLNYLLYLIGKN